MNHTFQFTDQNGKKIIITLPAPKSQADQEDQETFEVLLSQYGVLEEIDVDKKIGGFDGGKEMKGRLVLVDEDNGQVVGTLAENVSVREDQNVTEPGREKEPVVVDIQDDAIRIHTIDYEGTYTAAQFVR
jgi:spartin